MDLGGLECMEGSGRWVEKAEGESDVRETGRRRIFDG